MPANLDLIPNLKLIRKHHDQSIHDIGNVIFGQQGNSRSHNGNTSQKLQGLNTKSEHQGNENGN